MMPNIRVFDVEDFLPHFVISNNGIYEVEKKVGSSDGTKNSMTEDKNGDTDKSTDQLGDTVLGDMGEKYILNLLEEEKNMNSNISSIEWVAKERPKSSLGYDIEVKLSDESLLGVEVKSSRVRNVNTIHLTNNEIKAAIELKVRYYIVILEFDGLAEEVRKMYSINNIIDSFKINLIEIKNLLSPKIIGDRIVFYPQVFNVTIPRDLMKSYEVKSGNQLITEIEGSFFK